MWSTAKQQSTHSSFYLANISKWGLVLSTTQDRRNVNKKPGAHTEHSLHPKMEECAVIHPRWRQGLELNQPPCRLTTCVCVFWKVQRSTSCQITLKEFRTAEAPRSTVSVLRQTLHK